MANFQNCRLLDTAMQCISLDREETDPVLEEYRQMLHDILYGEYDHLEAERILRENIFIFREAAALDDDSGQARVYRLSVIPNEVRNPIYNFERRLQAPLSSRAKPRDLSFNHHPLSSRPQASARSREICQLVPQISPLGRNDKNIARSE